MAKALRITLPTQNDKRALDWAWKGQEMDRINIKEHKKAAMLGAVIGAVAGGVLTADVLAGLAVIGVQLAFWPVLDWWLSDGKDRK